MVTIHLSVRVCVCVCVCVCVVCVRVYVYVCMCNVFHVSSFVRYEYFMSCSICNIYVVHHHAVKFNTGIQYILPITKVIYADVFFCKYFTF